MKHNFKTFCQAYKDLEKKYDYNEPWVGLVGKNYFNNEATSKKVYFQIWNKLQDIEYPFLSNYNLYNSFFNSIDFTRCANNGIALKYNYRLQTYSSYFHIKLNENYKFQEKDIFIKLPLHEFKKAISVEFDTVKTDIKRYYYIYSKNDIEYILAFFQIKEDSNNIKYIEYTHNPKKIILIYNDSNNVISAIKNNCNIDIINDVEKVNRAYNTLPSYFGKYFNIQKYSVYWDINRNNNFIDSFLYEL
jgi:hypothetical protein